MISRIDLSKIKDTKKKLKDERSERMKNANRTLGNYKRKLQQVFLDEYKRCFKGNYIFRYERPVRTNGKVKFVKGERELLNESYLYAVNKYDATTEEFSKYMMEEFEYAVEHSNKEASLMIHITDYDNIDTYFFKLRKREQPSCKVKNVERRSREIARYFDD
jgi:hypothetical protein